MNQQHCDALCPVPSPQIPQCQHNQPEDYNWRFLPHECRLKRHDLANEDRRSELEIVSPDESLDAPRALLS